MHQILLRIPLPGTDSVITLHGYGLAMALGFLIAILLAARRAKRDGQPPDVIYNAAMVAFFGGILGARLFFVVQYSGQFPSLWDLLRIWEGGLTFYGGFLLAVLSVLAYLRLTGRPILYWLDLMAPSVALGEGFGRIGCFLNGCCYGDTCRPAWGMIWPAGTIPWQHYADELLASLGYANAADPALSGALAGSLAAAWQPPPIFPSQPASFINAILLAAVLYAMLRWKRRHGQVILMFAVLYGASRFLLEMIRADEAEAYLLGLPALLSALGLTDLASRLPGLTISQNVAIVMVAGGGAALVWLLRSRRPELQAAYVPPAMPAAKPTKSGPRGKRAKR